jgi:hypoxanthine phosphoribosyltransferase
VTGITEVFTADRIARRIAALGAEIRSGAKGGDVFLLGILKGAAVFLSDLLRAIEGDVSYGFIDVVRDFSDTATASAVEIDYISHIDIAGRNVYVIKDVVSTGVIENYLLMQLRMHSPASLQLVALIDRPSQRTVDLTADYRAFEADDGDGAFVGYGLEIDGRYGNLPSIARVNPTTFS